MGRDGEEMQAGNSVPASAVSANKELLSLGETLVAAYRSLYLFCL